MNKLHQWIRNFRDTDDVITKTHKKQDVTSIYREDSKLLATEGAGTICLRLEQPKPFNIDLIARNALLRLSVSRDSIKLYCIYKGRFILLKQDFSSGIGLGSTADCVYWLSFQASNRTILYGKKKPDSRNIAFHFTLPASNKSAKQYWMNKIGHYRVDSPAVIYLASIAINPSPPFKARINLLSSR